MAVAYCDGSVRVIPACGGKRGVSQWEQSMALIILDQTKNGDRLGIPLCDPAIRI
jgi:hypothetical protein